MWTTFLRLRLMHQRGWMRAHHKWMHMQLRRLLFGVWRWKACKTITIVGCLTTKHTHVSFLPTHISKHKGPIVYAQVMWCLIWNLYLAFTSNSSTTTRNTHNKIWLCIAFATLSFIYLKKIPHLWFNMCMVLVDTWAFDCMGIVIRIDVMTLMMVAPSKVRLWRSTLLKRPTCLMRMRQS